MPGMVYILRGLPGAGKSTYARRFPAATTAVINADAHHVVDGVYKFDPAKAPAAHNSCLRDYMGLLVEMLAGSSPKALVGPLAGSGPEVVVVDNTNTTLHELAPYVRIAEALGVDYAVVTVVCPLGVALGRNTHQVPAATMLRMNRDLLLCDLPPWWKQTTVVFE